MFFILRISYFVLYVVIGFFSIILFLNHLLNQDSLKTNVLECRLCSDLVPLIWLDFNSLRTVSYSETLQGKSNDPFSLELLLIIKTSGASWSQSCPLVALVIRNVLKIKKNIKKSFFEKLSWTISDLNSTGVKYIF